MTALAESIVTGVYAGYLARSVLDKFTRALSVGEEPAATALEELTNGLVSKTPLMSADIGLYARNLASQAILNSTANLETAEVFDKTRARFRNMAYENDLTDYVFRNAAAATAACKFFSDARTPIFELMDKCRAVIDRIATLERTPVELNVFTWGPLNDVNVANHALNLVVNQTGFPEPSSAHILTVLRSETESFFDYIWENSEKITSLLARVASEDTNPHWVGVTNSHGMMTDFVESFLDGSFIRTANILGVVAEYLALKASLEALDLPSDESTEASAEIRDTAVSRLSRIIMVLLGAVEQQRQTIYANSVVLYLDSFSPPLKVYLNGDNAEFISDEEARQKFISGIYEFSKTGMTVPKTGLNKTFVESSLPYYTDRANQAIEDRTEEAQRNLYSRAQNEVVPMVISLIKLFQENIPNPQPIGNVDAVAMQTFSRMSSQSGMSPTDYLLSVVAQMTGQKYLIDLMDVQAKNEGWWFTEAATALFVQNLISDFFETTSGD